MRGLALARQGQGRVRRRCRGGWPGFNGVQETELLRECLTLPNSEEVMANSGWWSSVTVCNQRTAKAQPYMDSEATGKAGRGV
eukprot:1159521-Pelagomonas_calceolata.AAC.15